MFNVCPACGLYSVEKVIRPDGQTAICPECGYAHPFRRLPLFVVTGASGAGKTAMCLHLAPLLPSCVVLEGDILWRPEFATPENNYRAFYDTWLRLAKNIGQSGHPLVFCGTALPDSLEQCPERRYVGEIHFLALTCADDILAARLRARPAWRNAGTDAFVQEMLTFNHWIRHNAATTTPPMTLLDTSQGTPQDTALAVKAWIEEILAMSPS